MSSERSHLILKNRQSAAFAYGDDDNGENLTNTPPKNDPTMNRELQHPTSNTETLLHLLKGSMGPGILSMPEGFKNAGLYVGLFGSIILGLFCTLCIQMLVVCAHELCHRMQMPSMDFADVCYYAFKTGPHRFRKFAKCARLVTNIFICMTQFGICCVYIVFVATNMHKVIETNVGHVSGLDIRTYIAMLLIPFILLSFLKNLKILVPVSMLAGILTIATVIIEFIYVLRDVPPTSSVKAFSSWHQLPLFFGTAIFAFEGIAVVLPLENNMKTPKDFIGWNGVLNTGMVLMTCSYIASGFYGYLKYGNSTASTILLNFNPNDVLAQVAKWLMLSSIFLSYALQFYVPFEIIKPSVRAVFPRYDDYGIGDAILRCSLVLLTFILPISMPNLGPILAFVGSISSSALALIFPPIVHILVNCPVDGPHGFGRFNWKLWIDIIIFIFGICGSITGTYASISALLNPPNK